MITDRNWLYLIIVIISIILGPVLYNEHRLGLLWKALLAMCFAVCITVLVWRQELKDAEKTIPFEKIIFHFSDISFSFYVVHVLILYSSGFINNYMHTIFMNESIALLVSWFLTLLLTIVSAELFHIVVYKNSILIYEIVEKRLFCKGECH
jgi:peptidoglycan/LPS O-acetylase OafA/YrhL